MKKVLVQVSDKNYLEHSKSLFVNAKLQGKWDGDYCLIANNIDSQDLKDFENTNIEIVHVKNLNYYYATLDVFDFYFKKWDFVLYMDADIIILGDISIEPTPKENTIIMDHDGLFKISQYFCQKCNEIEKNNKLNELRKKYSFLDDVGYNAGFMYLHTSLIDKNTKNELLKLQNELSEINHHAGIGSDQPIINLYFKKYINSNSFCNFWRIPEHQMKKALHFCHGEAPWINNNYSNILNKTYRQQYIENLQAFNDVMKVK